MKMIANESKLSASGLGYPKNLLPEETNITTRPGGHEGREDSAMKVKEISEDSRAYFQQFYKEHDVIGCLEDCMCDRVIVKSRQECKGWTPFGTARDCGDYYIIARYSRFDRLDKKTMKLEKDVEDR